MNKGQILYFVKLLTPTNNNQKLQTCSYYLVMRHRKLAKTHGIINLFQKNTC